MTVRHWTSNVWDIVINGHTESWLLLPQAFNNWKISSTWALFVHQIHTLICWPVSEQQWHTGLKKTSHLWCQCETDYSSDVVLSGCLGSHSARHLGKKKAGLCPWCMVCFFYCICTAYVCAVCVQASLIQKTIAFSRSEGSFSEALKVEKRLTEAATFSMLIISTVYAIIRTSIMDTWALWVREKERQRTIQCIWIFLLISYAVMIKAGSKEAEIAI